MECQAALYWYHLFWANGQRVAYKMTTQVRLFVSTCRNVFSVAYLSFKKNPDFTCFFCCYFWCDFFYARLLDQRGKGKSIVDLDEMDVKPLC